jgi:hypothetical protein
MRRKTKDHRERANPLHTLFCKLPTEYLEAVAVMPPTADDAEEDGFFTELEIAVLFPMLSDVHRKILIAVSLSWKAYVLCKCTPREGLNVAGRLKHTRATKSAEKKWKARKAAVITLMKTAQLTALQRGYIEQIILTPPTLPA